MNFSLRLLGSWWWGCALAVSGCWLSHGRPGPDASVPVDVPPRADAGAPDVPAIPDAPDGPDAPLLPGCFEGPVVAYVDESGRANIAGLHVVDMPGGYAVFVKDHISSHVLRLDPEGRLLRDTRIEEMWLSDLWRLHTSVVAVSDGGIESYAWDASGELVRTPVTSGRVVAAEPPIGDMHVLLDRGGSMVWAQIVDRGAPNVPYLFNEQVVAALTATELETMLLTGDTLRSIRGLGTASTTGRGYYLSPDGSGRRAEAVGPEAAWTDAPSAIWPRIFDDDAPPGGGLAVTVRRPDGLGVTTTHIENIPHYTRFPGSDGGTGVTVASGEPLDVANDEARLAIAHDDGARVYRRDTLELVATLTLEGPARTEVRTAVRDEVLTVAYIDAGIEPFRPRIMVQCMALPPL